MLFRSLRVLTFGWSAALFVLSKAAAPAADAAAIQSSAPAVVKPAVAGHGSPSAPPKDAKGSNDEVRGVLGPSQARAVSEHAASEKEVAERSAKAAGPSEAAAPSAAEAAPRVPVVNLRKIRLKDGEYVAPTDSGESASLTLRPSLQEPARKLLRRARPVEGAILVADPRTGELLAFAELTSAQAPPGSLLTTARLPAASLFKIVTTAALFERSPVTPTLRVCTEGGQRRIERKHLEPARGAHALCAPFSKALGQSRNAAYAQLATRYLTRQDLVEMAKNFGFNSDVAFDLDGTMGKAEFPYNDLEFAQAAAGFRGTKLSVLGAAQLLDVVATGGYVSRFSIVKRAGSYHAPKKREHLRRAIRRRTARRLVRMLEATVHSGTSLEAFTAESGMSYLGSVRVAGKTGTLRATRKSPTTSWFVGFAPSRRPELLVSVVLQNAPLWYRKANEVARDVLRVYFADKGTPGVTAPAL